MTERRLQMARPFNISTANMDVDLLGMAMSFPPCSGPPFN